MSSRNKLRAILFALTGFGNPVLASLMDDSRVEVAAVFTVKYKNPFPYYEERHLDSVCKESGIPCHYGIKVASDEGVDLIRSYSPDLILVATFKQILKQNVIDVPRQGAVNFHPSLLPQYRGPCPSNAALLNDDAVSGVTVHYVTEGLDEGDVLIQRSVPIGKNDIDGQLRQKLANLSGDMVPELIGMFAANDKPVGNRQDHGLASFAPKPTVEDGFLELAPDIQTIMRKMRALNPIPGTSILHSDKRIVVDHFDPLSSGQMDGIHENEDSVDLILNSEAIRLFKKVVT